jgi:DNA repair exonuclease SbcCD ATPase subunit
MLSDEVSYLKLQIQLKDSENKRLNRIYTENIDLIKELNIENSSYKEKLKLLNDKLNEVSSNNYNELSGIKEKVALLKARNQSYEEEDKAFDKIFEEGILDGVGNNSDEETKNLINGINELPKGNNRRISQLRFLVNKLKNLAQNNAILNAKLNNLQIENNKYKEESNIYQNIAQNSNEPYEYLLKELEKKDSELLYYKEAMNDREIRFKQVMQENENIKARCNSLEKDLKQILENRDKIDKLDFLVGKIVENQKMFFGSDKFKYNQPSGNKNNMKNSGKKQIYKSTNVKFK